MAKAASTSSVRKVEHTPELLRLRGRAAFIRALLDELDRIVPREGAGRELGLVTQVIDELTGLGCKIRDCALTLARSSEGPAHLDSGATERDRSDAASHP